jgi:hypothetical protein
MRKKGKLRVPVTKGLKDIYAMDMHLAFSAACAGRFNVTAFGRLAAAISVIRTALEQRQNIHPDATAVLDHAIAILLVIKEKGDATDIWEITEIDQPAVLLGIEVAEECIGMLDVALLAETAAKLLQDVYGGPVY